jgi:Na+/H+ antiporter NhaD/arsenite permease-like protein
MHSMLSIPIPLVIPFVSLLLAIAVFPLAWPHFWGKNLNKAIVALIISLPVLIFFIRQHEIGPLSHSLHEYVSFLCLLGSLFIVSGGIVLHSHFDPKPLTNVLFLAIGAVLANFVGTTGASMLLIRPFLKVNGVRKNTYHQPIFFIFVVSNAGGLLTPLGDPPLFLGYLRGVPFAWTLQLLPVWLLMIGSLLTIFYIWDYRSYRKENLESPIDPQKSPRGLRIEGGVNGLFFAGILGAVFLPSPWREASMVAMAAASLMLTPAELHEKNSFTFHPILEVGILFLGIFITMIPALILLAKYGKNFGLSDPTHFFWASGLLSSFLDNAPTYLTFFSVAQGVGGSGPLVAGVPELLLRAISCGAVLMGANSYIGNGPNFMVKAIADEADFKTPKFFAYIGYALMILFPLYLLVTLIFFRG